LGKAVPFVLGQIGFIGWDSSGLCFRPVVASALIPVVLEKQPLIKRTHLPSFYIGKIFNRKEDGGLTLRFGPLSGGTTMGSCGLATRLIDYIKNKISSRKTLG